VIALGLLAAPLLAQHAVPFEIRDNRPMLRARVEGSDPKGIVLDTGAASALVLERELALDLGLEILDEQERHVGAGEGVRSRMGRAGGVRIDLGGLPISFPRIATLGFSNLNHYNETPIEGLLGHGFLAKRVVEIDYIERTVRIQEPGTFEISPRGRELPLEFEGHLPIVTATLALPGGRKLSARLAVDTGTRLALLLLAPFVDEHDLLEIPGGTAPTVVGCGAGGESRGALRRIDGMRLGPFRVDRPVVALSRDRAGVFVSRSFDGILGGAILKRCRVVFDYAGRRMVLEPGPFPPAPYVADMSGLFMALDPVQAGRFEVRAVVPGSPAHEAGIRVGDFIRTIDGRPAHEFELGALRELLIGEGRRVGLGIERGSEEAFLATLVLRPLV